MKVSIEFPYDLKDRLNFSKNLSKDWKMIGFFFTIYDQPNELFFLTICYFEEYGSGFCVRFFNGLIIDAY